MRLAIPTLYQLGAVRRRLCQVKSDHGPLAARLVHVKASPVDSGHPAAATFVTGSLGKTEQTSSSSNTTKGWAGDCTPPSRAGRLSRCMQCSA